MRHWLLAGALTAAIILAGLGSMTVGLARAAGASGVKEFQLYATDGWVTVPDGERIYIWGFSDRNEKGSATLPGPAITVNEGDQVKITLTNIGPAQEGAAHPNHTIHLHGLDVDQANDGVGHTSHEVAHGDSFTYEFKATHAGTYWYHCHVDPTEHVQMGMYGAIIVKAPNGEKKAWADGPAYDREVTLVLSELDPAWHTAVYDRKTYDRTDYHPRYWLINGKAAPDVMSDLNSVVQGKVGEKVLVRLINAGYQWHAMHMHGFHFDVIASDGRPMPFAWSKDTLSIGPAERYDLLVTLTQQGAFPFHDHNELSVTNNGALGIGGMHTMVYAGVPVPDEHAGHDHTPPPVPPVPAAATVTMRGATFQPAELEVKAGTTVTWVNQDFYMAHRVGGDGWESGLIGYSGTYTHTFTKPGTYEIECSLHPTMRGTVTVKP